MGKFVFLTKSGKGTFVVMDIEDYERDREQKMLLESGGGCPRWKWLLYELKTVVGGYIMVK